MRRPDPAGESAALIRDLAAELKRDPGSGEEGIVGHIEVDGRVWRKSSHSGSDANCVEAAFVPGVIVVRDSKNPHGPKLSFSYTAFTHFVTAAKYRRHTAANGSPEGKGRG